MEKRVEMKLFLLHKDQPGLSHLLKNLRGFKNLQISHGLERPQGFNQEDVMIQWGVGDKDEHCIKINSTASIDVTKDKRKMKRVLALNGISYSPVDPRTHNFSTQRYIIPIFHLEPLAVYRRQIGIHTKYEQIDLNRKSRSISQFIRDAIKTVYCLGLDFAIVTLAVQWGKTKHIVQKVDPSPELTIELADLFAKAIYRFELQYKDETYKNTQALLGMDPEFMLCRADGKVVSAAQFLQREGRAGYDGIRVKGKVVYPLVELRPKPSVEPRQLMIHLMQTMRKAANQIDNPHLSWVAGGMPKKGFCLGGHLHFSLIWLNSRLLRALDNYLALPLILIEDETSRNRRLHYGFLGDFRHQFHGGFEYRTLPSWMVTPRITKGVIALARVIADNYRELKHTPLNDEKIQTCYYKGEKEPLREVVQSLWTDLEKLESYERYRSYLDPVKLQIMAMKPWNEARDLRRSWRIPPFHN
jgi:hypothetical protein